MECSVSCSLTNLPPHHSCRSFSIRFAMLGVSGPRGTSTIITSFEVLSNTIAIKKEDDDEETLLFSQLHIISFVDSAFSTFRMMLLKCYFGTFHQNTLLIEFAFRYD